MAAIETPAPPTAGTLSSMRPATPRRVRLLAMTAFSVVAFRTSPAAALDAPAHTAVPVP